MHVLTLIELYVQRELILWSLNLGIKQKKIHTYKYIYIIFSPNLKNSLKENFHLGFCQKGCFVGALPHELLCYVRLFFHL